MKILKIDFYDVITSVLYCKMLTCCDQNHNNDNNQHIFDFMKVNKPMEKSLIMAHNYLEILPGIFGEWGNFI